MYNTPYTHLGADPGLASVSAASHVEASCATAGTIH